MAASFETSWPPHLKEAFLSEWNKWLHPEILKEQNDTIPLEPLYHYTGEDAIKGILSNERLWCFSYLHQSDDTEFKYSLSVALKVISQVGQTKEWFRHYFCITLHDFLLNNMFADTFEAYLFSLSMHRDDRRQWERYGQKGFGFAIGFAPTLFQPDQEKPSEQANENFWVGRVRYGDLATRKRHRLVVQHAADITSRFAWANREAVNMLKPHVYLHEIVIEVTGSPLIWNCLMSKQKKYASEKEVRYISLNVQEKYDEHRKTHNGKNYIEYSLPLRKPGSIVEILVGPRAPVDAEDVIRKFLTAQGYPDNIPICRGRPIAARSRSR